jgi:hypothetical protein
MSILIVAKYRLFWSIVMGGGAEYIFAPVCAVGLLAPPGVCAAAVPDA